MVGPEVCEITNLILWIPSKYHPTPTLTFPKPESQIVCFLLKSFVPSFHPGSRYFLHFLTTFTRSTYLSIYTVSISCLPDLLHIMNMLLQTPPCCCSLSLHMFGDVRYWNLKT
jgi:hypothetical protein